MSTSLDVFISSKMGDELALERDALFDLIPNLLQGVVTLKAWKYDPSAPASDENNRQVYLNALQKSALYIGVFWNQYAPGTVDEFEHATKWGIDRHIYIKQVDNAKRDPRLKEFLDKNVDVPTGPASKWFESLDELRQGVKLSIEDWLVERLYTKARRERLELLIDLRKPLGKALSQYKTYLRKYPPYSNTGDLQRHRRIIDKAKDACVAAFDRGDTDCIECLKHHAGSPKFEQCSRKCEKFLAYIDEMRLTPWFVSGSAEAAQQKAEVERWGSYENRNLNALKDAVERLEELIAELQ